MDVARSPNPKQGPRRRALLLGGLAIVALGGATTALASLGRARPRLSRTRVRLEPVRRGSFVRDVQARGALVPEEVHWVTADGPARVARIAARPGAVLASGDVLVELVNADLELATLDAERQAAAARSALVALEVRAGTDLVASDLTLAGLTTERDVLAARDAANANLREDGLIPALDDHETHARAAGTAARLELERTRRVMQKNGMARQIESQKGEVEKLDQVAAFRKKQLALLETRAPIGGILQELPLEPGQWVTAGTVLAKIAKPGKLKAVLQVPEALIGDVALGHPVRLETPGGRVEGTVARVDPLVQAGVVKVEVTLLGDTPDGARADLAVTATIEVERVDDALVMTRPAGVAAGSTTEVYRLDVSGDGAYRTKVKVGRSSTREIEVLEGLAAGDTVVLGETEAFRGAEALSLAD